MKNCLQKLMAENRIVDIFILSRYFYKEGKYFIDNQTYDVIHRKFVESGVAKDYTTRVYEDDPIPWGLLEEFGLTPEKVDYPKGKDNPYYNELTYESSLSIKAVTTYEESWEYFKSVQGMRLIAMTKVDGIYTRHAIEDGLKLSLTRGRSEADPWDITEQLSFVIGAPASKIKEKVRVNGEAYVESSALEFLAEKYDGHLPPESRRFKTEKSSALSMSRVKHKAEDYKHFKFLMYSSDGLSDTISGTLEKGKELGFQVVPYKVIEVEDIPSGFEEFKVWLRDLMDIMLELQGEIPSDGVVIDVDDLTYIPDVKNQYSSRNIALKLEHWSHEYYVGVVKDIIEEQRAVSCSYVIVIEPLVTNDRTTARRINSFNPSILINENITIGSRVYFERNSGAVNIMLHGDKVPVSKDTSIGSF